MITIDEAIKTLDRWYSLDTLLPLDKAQDALKLGVEALRFKQRIRAHTVDDFDALLPGETKE